MEHIEKLCREYGVTPNQLYVLWCISKKRTPMENTKVALDIRLLQTKALIFITEKNISDKVDVGLTTLGNSLVTQINEMFKKRWALKDVTKDSNYRENMVKYRELWPKVSIGEGTNKRPLRSSPADIDKAFKNFFTMYPDTEWDDIFKATQVYINRWKEENSKTYMKNASSFIYKEKSQTISELAKEIEMFDTRSVEDSAPVIIPKSK